MTKLAVSCLILLAAQSLAVCEKFLDSVAMIESSRNHLAVGDGGRARGEFQFHKAAWEQVSSARKLVSKPTYPYHTHAHDKVVAREYAREYLTWISSSLERRLGRKAEGWEVYAAYNRGVAGFARLGYKFENLPPHTQKACFRLSHPPTHASTRMR